MLQSFRQLKIGKNNYIAKTAKIFQNVTIGDNNYIGENVTIYPNSEIGNNNSFFPGNIIGEFPVSSDDLYKTYNHEICKGVKIGDHNLFHVNNLIFSGQKNKTTIGNHNKFLAENHMGHDTAVHNYVTCYPRVIQGGHSVLLDYCNVGMGATIQQRKVVGQYSMLGGSNMYAKDVFPFFINIGGKILRLNSMKLDKEVIASETLLQEHYEKFLKKDFSVDEKLPLLVQTVLRSFYNNLRS
jgi:UDP-N-acetylglucosamine acyltransferase